MEARRSSRFGIGRDSQRIGKDMTSRASRSDSSSGMTVILADVKRLARSGGFSVAAATTSRNSANRADSKYGLLTNVELDKLAVDLKTSHRERVPQILMATDFEYPSQIVVRKYP